jgi:hypothetical protein
MAINIEEKAPAAIGQRRPRGVELAPRQAPVDHGARGPVERCIFGETGMIFRAELSCLNCGYDVGEVEGERGAAVEDVIFLPVHQGDRLLVDGAQRLRCPRCGGQILSHSLVPARHPLDPATVCEADLTEGLGGRLAS